MPAEERDKTMSKAVAISSPENSVQRENPFVRGKAFLGDVRSELRKVSTPSRAEVQSTTTVVILAVFGFAAFFYVIDSVLGFALKALFHWLGASQ